MTWKTIFGSLLIPLNAILLFFLLFDSRLVVPAWLQVFGRLHPMALHFPIVLVIGYALWECIRQRYIPGPQPLQLDPSPRPPPARDPGQASAGTGYWSQQVADCLVLSAAFTSVLTAVMGLLLSKEGGYEGASIGWHKWLVALASFGLMSLYYFRSVLSARRVFSPAAAGLLLVLVMVAGHLGGTITHGENFVLGPVLPE